MQERIEITNWHVADLLPDPDNPRRNDAAVPGVKESIRQFGFRVPIVIDAEGHVAAGHTRLKAAIELGLDEVPCVVADKLTKKQLKAFQLADNKTGEFASWDVGLLATELDDLAGAFDMSVFGFDMKPKKEKAAKATKDPQWVICPRCGARILRQKAIEYSTEDFESESYDPEEEGDLE
ncbi:MAG: ParB N-terminal domain-containing protein [Clostridia bacterium]|nr:ParB N-terminal domain-containing protein [Clostridia bacterium]